MDRAKYSSIRPGIGGWTYPAWRGGVFFPEGLRQADELAFAARAVSAIEINATFYRRQAPESFAAWRAATPEGFVFALKGSRFVTNRKVLATAGEGLANFFAQGLSELGDRLGPVVWQLAATKQFEPDDIAAFLALLPASVDGLPLRHVIEVGHSSFACPEFVALARAAGVAICYSDHPDRRPIADRTAPLAYARLQGMKAKVRTGYSQSEIARIAEIARAWATGRCPPGLPYAGDRAAGEGAAGEVFVFFINGAKERAPAAAQALRRALAR
ncbi:DUF72 domain-containing protein [Novosphingobium tardum]|uniref:DUF72 domain-containing protein n=1 Tax=Novosphingobium tardum TaxID=1538021 RepID=A0ABV8RQV0_9SPHN